MYKSVDLYSKGSLNSNLSSESNKDLLYERIKKAIVESDLFNSIIMTSYAEGIDADIYDDINIKIDNYDGDTKVQTTLNVSDGHKIVLTCIFNIGYESNVKISDATNIEKTLNFDNLDFSISLNMKEFSVKDELTVSGKQKIEDASKLISEDSKKSF